MFKKSISILMVLAVVFVNILPVSISAFGKEDQITPNKLYSKSAALIDAHTQTLLYGKNENEPLAMASTTKIMTCIIALEYGDINKYAKVSKKAQSQPKVHLGMKEGEEYLIKDLLYSLMLESHNDSAVCIAEAIGLDVDGFAKLMNEKADELGLKNTYFITSNGLDEADEKGFHHTTAIELAKIMRYCIYESPKKTDFIKISQTTNYSFKDKSGKRSFNCTGHNLLLGMMDGVVSGKTGYTSKAGYCYVGAVEKNNKVYIVALLACGWPNNKNYKWSDAKALLNYGINNYYYIDVLELNPPIRIDKRKRVLFKNKNVEPKYCDMILKKDIAHNRYIIVSDKSKLKVKYSIKDDVYAPVKKSEEVGYLCYYIDDKIVRKDYLMINNDIAEPGYRFYVRKILDIYMNF